MNKHMTCSLTIIFSKNAPVREKSHVWPSTLDHVLSVNLIQRSNPHKSFDPWRHWRTPNLFIWKLGRWGRKRWKSKKKDLEKRWPEDSRVQILLFRNKEEQITSLRLEKRLTNSWIVHSNKFLEKGKLQSRTFEDWNKTLGTTAFL